MLINLDNILAVVEMEDIEKAFLLLHEVRLDAFKPSSDVKRVCMKSSIRDSIDAFFDDLSDRQVVVSRSFVDVIKQKTKISLECPICGECFVGFVVFEDGDISVESKRFCKHMNVRVVGNVSVVSNVVTSGLISITFESD